MKYMKFVLLFGPQAVGKMTVGKELMKISDLRLFHNHMTNELTATVFGRDRPERRELSDKFRMDIFSSFATSDLPWLIFTLVWALDLEEDWQYVDTITWIFREQGWEIYFVELETTLDERLVRNKTWLRLEEKPSKRNIVESEKELLRTHETHRLNSHVWEIREKNYMRIDNTNISPEETAKMIKERFGL